MIIALVPENADIKWLEYSIGTFHSSAKIPTSPKEA